MQGMEKRKWIIHLLIIKRYGKIKDDKKIQKSPNNIEYASISKVNGSNQIPEYLTKNMKFLSIKLYIFRDIWKRNISFPIF